MNNKIDKNGHLDIEREDKNWPADNKMVGFPDIADPIREALQIAMDKGEKVYEEGIEWTGLKQGFKNQATVPSPLEALHSYNLKRSNKKQNRDVFTEIITIAIQLGMEQGRREIIQELKEVSFVFSSETGKKVIEQITRDREEGSNYEEEENKES